MAAEGTDDSYAKLTSNELAFGPLPEAEAALSEVLPRANRYPDSHASRLRQVVADSNPGTETRHVLVGNGQVPVGQPNAGATCWSATGPARCC